MARGRERPGDAAGLEKDAWRHFRLTGTNSNRGEKPLVAKRPAPSILGGVGEYIPSRPESQGAGIRIDAMKELVTRKHAAEMLQVCTRTIARYESAGRLTPIRLTSRSIRYDAAQLDRLIEDSTSTGLRTTDLEEVTTAGLPQDE